MTDNERIAELEAQRNRLREALERIHRIPAIPFPDPGAHSERAFSDAVWTAWSRMHQIASAALSATGEHEHPDTMRLDKLGRWLKTHSDERAVVIRDNGIVRGCPSHWCGEDLGPDVVGVTLRSAIDALMEARDA